VYGQPDAHDSAARSAGDFLNLKTVLTCTANVGNAHLGNVREVSSSFEFETETLDDLLESSTGEQNNVHSPLPAYASLTEALLLLACCRILLGSHYFFFSLEKTGLMLSSGSTRKKNVKKDDTKAGVIVGKEADSSAGGENVINFQEGRSRERSGEFVLEFLVGCGADATMKVILIGNPCCGLVDGLNVRWPEREA